LTRRTLLRTLTSALMLGAALTCGATLVLAQSAAAQSATAPPAAVIPTTIFVVRHGEKVGPTGDVPLSAEGKARAVALASVLRSAGVTAIFTSDTIRTRDTAAPLARQLAITPQELPSKDLDGLVRKLTALPAGSVVLVVHHSNTVPEIVEKLGGGPQTPYREDEFDRLAIVTRAADGAAHAVTLRYGASDSAPQPMPSSPKPPQP
jgi:phosphohistidine phosphatase SixA